MNEASEAHVLQCCWGTQWQIQERKAGVRFLLCPLEHHRTALWGMRPRSQGIKDRHKKPLLMVSAKAIFSGLLDILPRVHGKTRNKRHSLHFLLARKADSPSAFPNSKWLSLHSGGISIFSLPLVIHLMFVDSLVFYIAAFHPTVMLLGGKALSRY